MLSGADVARAAECLEDGTTPISNAPFYAAQELEFNTGSHDVFDEPFATLTVDGLGVYWESCSPDCQVSAAKGETLCGNLAQDPVDYQTFTRIGVPQEPDAFAELAGSIAANGKWSFFGQAFVHPTFRPGSSTTYATMQIRLGTREIFDVASSVPGPQPVQLRLLVGSHLGLNECQAVFHAIPNHSLLLRVRDNTGGTQLLLQGYQNFFGRDETFEIQVSDATVLQMDVLLDVAAQAQQGQIDLITFDPCPGAVSVADFVAGFGGVPEDATDGVQIFVTPPPGVTMTPRSGLAYETVPEPSGGVAAAGAALLLLARRRAA